MKFSENLQKLRKEYGYSQEQLADELGVSRQAVSKWESASSFPEMDTLIAMSELFHCSLDELIKNEVTIEKSLGKKEYDHFYHSFTIGITSGVGLILIGLILMLLLEEYIGDKTDLPVISLLLMTTIAISLFIYYGLQREKYEHMDLPTYSIEEYEKEFSNQFIMGIVIGVALCIFGVISMIALEPFFPASSDLPVIIFLGFVTVAVILFVYCGMMRSKYTRDKSTNDNVKKDAKEKNSILIDKVSSIIMLVATFIYLFLGFVLNLWHPGWVIFPLGGILCAIFEVILGND